MTASHGLSGVLAEIAEVIGLEATLALADQVGGTRIDIPREVRSDDHWLVKAIGRQAADKLCRHYAIIDADGRRKGARNLLIPRGPMGLMRKARARLVAELEAGSSVRKAARAAGLSERAAWYTKARLAARDDDDQGSLF